LQSRQEEKVASFDDWFEEYGRASLPVYDWRWFKAQARAESSLNPEAVSPAGAQGLMQIMPGTWADLEEELGIIASPFNAKVNIRFGVHYMRKMVRFWKAPRTDEERLKLAQASYNAGAGSILRAQRLCNDASLWSQIAWCLPEVTGGKNSHETITYVERIARYYDELTTS
jgi:membrane-bound lytic murein transglycosylase MltF